MTIRGRLELSQILFLMSVQVYSLGTAGERRGTVGEHFVAMGVCACCS